MFLSVILPCYREATNLPAMLAALQKVLDQIPGTKEILAIDDGSPDNTYDVLCSLRPQYKYLHIVRFARNFGKEAALTCGLNMAKGDAVVMLDSDLQHPPEVILEMLEKWKQGDRMVYALRRNRNSDSKLYRLYTKIFYWIFRNITDLDLPPGAGDFRLMDRKVVDALNRLPERNRFMKGLMTWVGFKSGSVYFDVAERAGGISSFSFSKLFVFAINGLTSFSTIPLRIWSLCGVVISTIALLYLGWLVIRTLAFGIDVPGYASLMCSVLFIGGIQLISLGVIGEYIGRIYNEVKDRPIYIVSDEIGSDSIDLLHNLMVSNPCCKPPR
ncbi:MAG: glycosyltransferase family 2 protein [Proteobacteria bacterium]|nr:glycosyltransferase family 2 protein [Pseudomonadota bacterium]